MADNNTRVHRDPPTSRRSHATGGRTKYQSSALVVDSNKAINLTAVSVYDVTAVCVDTSSSVPTSQG